MLIAVVEECEAPRTEALAADVAAAILPAERVHGLGVTKLAIDQQLSLTNDLQLLGVYRIDNLLLGGDFDLDVWVQLGELLEAGISASDLANVLFFAVEVRSQVLYLDERVIV